MFNNILDRKRHLSRVLMTIRIVLGANKETNRSCQSPKPPTQPFCQFLLFYRARVLLPLLLLIIIIISIIILYYYHYYYYCH